jgi:hypothetical protein
MSHQVEPTGTGTVPPAAPQTEPQKGRDRRRLLIGGVVAGTALVTLASRSALAATCANTYAQHKLGVYSSTIHCYAIG